MLHVGGVFQVLAEAVEVPFCQGPSVGDPRLERSKSSRVDAADSHAAHLLGPDEAAGFEYVSVLHNGDERDGEWLGEFGH
ncbi:hypothetical protein [Leekyejoonella antrihumi]|uniref:hypothetical protein n=1 Tax=Leekyejoonella antrihumi TaxID=1660198 RepID=UPI001FE6EB90|nr:hypothetical protein [Leekyejoonella antrihumi]